MTYVLQAFAWLADPANLGGPGGVWARIGEHLWITLLATVIAALIGIPGGWAIGHTGRGRVLVTAAGAARALPSLGVLTLVALLLGIGLVGPIIALVVLAVPSVLAGAYAGFDAIERSTVQAARAVGMSEWQILTRVEVPLGVPLLLGGLRSATLQVLATATLAAYVGGGGLGRLLFLGLKTQNYPMMLAAAILTIALAVLLELTFELGTRLAARAVRPATQKETA